MFESGKAFYHQRVANGVQTDYGYIYIMSCQGLLKIGKSINPRSRVKALQTANAMPIRLMKQWRVSSMSAAEEVIHSELSDWRQKGEWFHLPSMTRRAILGIKSLETLLMTGKDEQPIERTPFDPIPDECRPDGGGWSLISPRATVWHRMIRSGARIMSLCGGAELTPENYWRMWANDKRVYITQRHRWCDECESAHRLKAIMEAKEDGNGQGN